MKTIWSCTRALGLILAVLALSACGQEDEPADDCDEGRVRCGSTCVDLDSSAEHCGQCGQSCGDEASCVEGQCQVPCTRTQTRCGDTCVDLERDPANCGACGTVCDEVCQDGACRPACEAGTTDCDGACVDTSTDAENCGGCGVACGETEVCAEGACGCPEGTERCGDVCVDLQSDASHCGGCDQACEAGPEVSEASCVEGACHTECEAGFDDCDGDPENGCEADLGSTATCGQCGVTCRDDQICSEAGCVCPEGLLECDGACVDPTNDPLHCGGCGFSCEGRDNAEAGTCEEGACVLTCDENFDDCDGDPENGCETSTYSDAANCGGCGLTCRDDQTCLANACGCPGGQVECDGLCVDTQQDPANCGSCGVACDGGCAEGVCCDAGFEACGALCVDHDTDAENCGACGVSCNDFPNSDSGTCEAGACTEIACADGYTNCNGDLADGCEIHTDTDIDNCGTCGNSCVIGCGAGACATVESFSARNDHGCALLSGDGSVKCWGNNGNGQIGNGQSGSPSPNPEFVLDPNDPTGRLTGATQVVTGFGHSCAITQAQTVKCWGSALDPATGAGYDATEPFDLQDPSDPSGLLTEVIQLASGRNFLCALQQGGGVKCWGLVPDGTDTPSTPIPVPLPVPASTSPLTYLSGVTQIAAGNTHACVLMGDATVRCWGKNGDGQLGTGDTTPSFLPVEVGGATPLTDVVEIVTSQDHSCARTDAGDVYCWGKNNGAQVGATSPNPTTLPEPVVGVENAVQLSAGLFNHTCARLADGTAKCWGSNSSGKRGNGETSGSGLAEFVLDDTGSQNMSGIAHIEAGNAHTCALLQSGDLLCWGRNNNGQLGDGTTTASTAPTLVSW